MKQYGKIDAPGGNIAAKFNMHIYSFPTKRSHLLEVYKLKNNILSTLEQVVYTYQKRLRIF